jgi:hypothetical protein
MVPGGHVITVIDPTGGGGGVTITVPLRGGGVTITVSLGGGVDREKEIQPDNMVEATSIMYSVVRIRNSFIDVLGRCCLGRVCIFRAMPSPLETPLAFLA